MSIKEPIVTDVVGGMVSSIISSSSGLSVSGPIIGLYNFYDTSTFSLRDNTYVTSVYDQSGSNDVMFQSESVRQPITTPLGVEFDRSQGDKLVMDDLAVALSAADRFNLSFTFSMQSFPYPPAPQILWMGTLSAGAWLSVVTDITNKLVVLRLGASGLTSSANTIVANQTYTVTIERNETSSKLWLDRNLIATRTDPGDGSNYPFPAVAGMLAGSDQTSTIYSSNSTFKGLVATGDVSTDPATADADRLAIWDYLDAIVQENEGP